MSYNLTNSHSNVPRGPRGWQSSNFATNRPGSSAISSNGPSHLGAIGQRPKTSQSVASAPELTLNGDPWLASEESALYFGNRLNSPELDAADLKLLHTLCRSLFQGAEGNLEALSTNLADKIRESNNIEYVKDVRDIAATASSVLYKINPALTFDSASMQNLTEKFSSLSAQLLAISSQNSQVLDATVEKQQQGLSTVAKDVETIRQSLENMEKSDNGWKSQCDTLQTEINTLRSEQKARESQVASLFAENETMKTELGALRAELQARKDAESAREALDADTSVGNDGDVWEARVTAMGPVFS